MPKVQLFLTNFDEPYLQRLRSVCQPLGISASGTMKSVDTISEACMWAQEKGTKFVATTSQSMLNLLLPEVRKGRTLNNYAGSIIEKRGVEFLILNPLEHLFTVAHGKFCFERYLKKFSHPQTFIQQPEFAWEVFDPAKANSYYLNAVNADFIACDIETGNEQDREITCISFTFATFVSGGYILKTIVVPFTDMYHILFVRKILDTETQKVFQNGKYDNIYLLRYNIITQNWSGDTQHMFHAWYSELPKRLDFITSFMLRKWEYWKSESATSDWNEYYRYNAKDSFVTALCWIALLKEAPTWAKSNYTKEFRLVFPALMAEFRGFKRDQVYMETELEKFERSLERQLLSIRKMVGNPSYNPSSSQQTVLLFEALGSSDVKSSDVAGKDKVASRHPLNRRIIDAIDTYREDRKLVTTYMKDEKDGNPKTWHGRIFYSLNPHTTDTSRLSSKESAFWCGWQIQNIPTDRDDIQIRGGIIADPGWFLGECDYAQNETWNTAYQSGDENLIKVIEDRSKDFHGTNASLFFGVPYEKIMHSYYSEEDEEWIHEKLDKVLRDKIGKRVNHGANYNMTGAMLVITMGIDNVINARNYLKLPRSWSLIKVGDYLLSLFDRTYPGIRLGAWYDWIKTTVNGSHMLVCPTGWTRYCFGNPGPSNKRDMNRYAAHPPQCLAAQRLNDAYVSVFYNVALPNPTTFHLGPQIHDSILFSYLKGHHHHIAEVAEYMKITTPVKDVFGKVRNLTVPVDMKGEAERWSELKTLKKRYFQKAKESMLQTLV